MTVDDLRRCQDAGIEIGLALLGGLALLLALAVELGLALGVGGDDLRALLVIGALSLDRPGLIDLLAVGDVVLGGGRVPVSSSSYGGFRIGGPFVKAQDFSELLGIEHLDSSLDEVAGALGVRDRHADHIHRGLGRIALRGDDVHSTNLVEGADHALPQEEAERQGLVDPVIQSARQTALIAVLQPGEVFVRVAWKSAESVVVHGHHP